MRVSPRGCTLQSGSVSGTGLVYQLLNLFGACGMLVSLGQFNVSVFVLEIVWMTISVFAMVRTVRGGAARRAD